MVKQFTWTKGYRDYPLSGRFIFPPPYHAYYNLTFLCSPDNPEFKWTVFNCLSTAPGASGYPGVYLQVRGVDECRVFTCEEDDGCCHLRHFSQPNSAPFWIAEMKDDVVLFRKNVYLPLIWNFPQIGSHFSLPPAPAACNSSCVNMIASQRDKSRLIDWLINWLID